jgi:hypothetical protein
MKLFYFFGLALTLLILSGLISEVKSNEFFLPPCDGWNGEGMGCTTVHYHWGLEDPEMWLACSDLGNSCAVLHTVEGKVGVLLPN